MNNVKQMFKRHYSRLMLEAVLKSVLAGLAVGCAANFLTALAAWVFDFGGVWFAIGVGGGVWLLSSLLFFFLKYKPSMTETAERMDRLGLSERMITMLELQGDQSYIAQVQRENAKASIARVENRKLRLRVSRLVIVLATVALVLGSTMTTITGLADNDVLPEFNEIVEDPFANHIPVTYMVEEGGWIEGETDQLVEPGGSTTPVVAMAEDGWIFEGWDDGYADPERFEAEVTTELYFVAVFVQIEEGDGSAEGEGEGGKEGSDSSEGDKAEDLPANGGANVENGENGANGSDGDGNGSKGESEGGQGSSEEQGEGKGDGKGQGAGGKWEDSNQIIDGKTYYRDQLDEYYQRALEIFEQNGEIPPELREFFETYFDSI